MKLINKLKDLGVKIHQWSPEMMDLFKKNWLIVVEEEAIKTRDFKSMASLRALEKIMQFGII